jgi:purine-cytosine permease-like protein
MLAVGTPESLAAVDEARAERSGMPPSAPVASPPAPVEEPAAFLAPPAEDEPAAFLPPPAEEPAAFLPPPAEEPAAFLPPPAEEPAAFLPPPTEEPAAFVPPPTEEPVADDPFDIFSAAIDHPDQPVPPPTYGATTFPGFAPPTDATTTDFAAPSDPRELSFDNSSQPDTPVFLEPVAPASVPSAPSGPPSWNLDAPASPVSVPVPSPVEPVSGSPVSESQVSGSQWAEPTDTQSGDAGAPPALVEPPTPDGVSDLWRAASEGEPSAPSDPPPISAAPEPAPPPSADLSASPPSPGVPHGFDDLLSGSDEPEPPNSEWIAEESGTAPQPPSDAEAEDRRPFGEGVDRDEAIDPSDSILGAPLEQIGVATAATVQAAPKISPAEPFGLEPTPVEQRVGRAARLFWLWFAANSSIAAIVFGTIIFALGVSLRQAIVATLAGVALSFLPLGLGTLAGKRSGQPTMVISRATFGIVGNILPSLIALFSRLFWAAGLLWVLGAGTADILTGAKLTDGFTTGQLTIIVMAIGFILAVVLAYFGYGLIAWVQLVISVISGIAIVGFVLLTLQYVNFTTALSTQDGPWILVVTGAVLVFSFVGLAWANSSADVARYQRPESSGATSMLWATFGVALPSFILIAYGALLAASNPTLAANIAADPLDSLGRLLPVWYPAPLLVATGLSLLSGIVLAIYSGGFALGATGLRLRRSLSTLIVGVLVLLIALIMSSELTDFSQLFRDLATTVAVPVAAWAGIFGSEIMIRRRRFDSQSLLSRGGVYADVRWGNLIALVAISVLGYGFLSATLSGLTWEGYLFSLTGVSLNSELATSDLGVLVALVLGLLYPLVAGRSGIRDQESATRSPE